MNSVVPPQICPPPGRSGGPRAVPLLAALSVLAACAGAPAPQGMADPDEAQNRAMHAFNLSIDRAIVSPAGGSYAKVVPEPVQRGVSNLADTLDLPGDIANNLLQARPGNAAHNTMRLAVNLTVGVLGLVDVASVLGIEKKSTDFGETLHVWGAEEGSYVVLPVLGPSTTRDTVGTLVDFALSPTRYILPSPESDYATGVKVLSRLGDRGRYSGTVDSILYDSADGYVQQRLLYLQNRRFELGQSAGDDSDFVDPYEDPYAE